MNPAAADLFPWTADDVAAWIAACPPRALHLTGLRLEAMAPNQWWADLTGYRADTRAPFVWQGFLIDGGPRRAPHLSVTLPPYLARADSNAQRMLVEAVTTLAGRLLADRETADAYVSFASLSLPDGVPRPAGVGGDRITPGHTPTAIWVHHAKRYRFALGHARGLDVLDLGCGVGYGTRMLAREARSVVGVDIAPEAIAYGTRAYASPRIRRAAADARRLPFPDASFDLVVCFEMIEHIEDHAVLLDEVTRVLRPGGRLVVSTPNKRFYEDQPDPDHFHCGLLELGDFRALLAQRFQTVELSAQPRIQGLADVTDEFDVEPGADDGREMFIAVATTPAHARPAPARTAPPRGDSAMRILAFNWHEPYLALLARTGYEWIVADWVRPWNAAYRALPPNARLVRTPEEAAALVDGDGVDLVLCQSQADIAWIGGRQGRARVVYLAHNHLGNEVGRADTEAARQLRETVVRTIELRGGLFAAISAMKLESWSVPGVVIAPGIDLAEFDASAYTGEVASALTVANLLAERSHMLGGTQLAESLAGLPWTVLGKNPTLGTREAESWDALRAAYRTHRFYAHATLWPWEDGYNLAMLEAMASGQPVLTWANPTSPITEGIDGFVAGGPRMFRHWAMRLLEDPALARRIGAAARRTVAERFPFDAFAARWREAFARAAAATPAVTAAPRTETIVIPEAATAPAPAPTPQAPEPRPSPAPAPPRPVSPRARIDGDRRTKPRSGRGTTKAPGQRKRVVLATAWTPISTSMYYERAFRADHDVITWGPSMDEATFAEWREVTEQHALKATGSAEEKIRLLRGLSRPADVPARSGAPPIGELLERLPQGWRPDLFVWIDGGAGFVPRDVARLDCPTVCLVGDSHTQIRWRREYARAYSHVFLMFNRQHVATFAAAGCPSVGWLPAACDPEIHRAFDVEPAFDVVFVGQTLRQWHPDRVRLLERLIAAGFDVHVTTKILEEMALAFGRGRLVFNRSLAGDLNMRVFEALATGRLLLTDRLAPESGLDELFRDRGDLVCYDEDNLEALAQHYLEHPEEREAIAAAGRAKVLAEHTYQHRVASILETVLGIERREIGSAARHSLIGRGPEVRPPTRQLIGGGPGDRPQTRHLVGGEPGVPPQTPLLTRGVTHGRSDAREDLRSDARGDLRSDAFDVAPALSGTAASELPAYFRNERPEVAALVPGEARRVLDVGCAAGGLGRLLKAQGPREIIGIELHPGAAAVAATVLDRVLAIDLDVADELPLEEGSLDCIVCADVLEHLREPARALATLRRYLRPGGTVIASVPNVRHANVLLPLLVHGRWEYRDEGILDRTHLRFFTLAEIGALFAEVGLEIGDVRAVRTAEHPALAGLAGAVTALGGDGDRFRDESAIVQFVVTATARPAPVATPDAGATAAPPETTARAPRRAPATSIVIPVWNRAEFTACCLRALARTVDPADTEVIVVDNGSTDATASVLGAPPLPIRVVTNAENLGFARACNQGAAAARGPLLVFLNNDTEPEPGWLDALRAAAAEPGVGIVGARLLYPGTRRIQHAGLALTADGIPDHLYRNAVADDPRATEPRDVAMVTGACLAVRAEVFEQLGGFDMGYRNGVEDVDLCLAARSAGLRVRYEPRAVVLHHEGVSEGRFAHGVENLQRFAAKWASALATMERRPAEDFGEEPGPPIAWEGSFFLHHSLAGINRAVCGELLERGLDVIPEPFEADDFDPGAVPGGLELARQVERPTRTAPAIRVRHRFPPDWSRRPGERLAVIQPWEFGSVPAEWVRGIRESVDELWVPSEFVRQSYIAGGVPATRVVTVPNGFDPAIFRPDAAPMPLPTTRRFRFLYVGGSIGRKGYDVLLRAYAEEFTAADDVCLVIKDHAYYRHRIDDVIAQFRRAEGAPEILYFWDNVLPRDMAGFYAAASCLVHPFRGEGFGLPVLEAMACGRPVIVTDAGPVREFCPDDVATFVRATITRLPERRIDHLETVDVPTLAEPDVASLRQAMRAAYADPEGCAARGRRAAAHAHTHYTWSSIAARYAERLRALASAPPREPAPAGGTTQPPAVSTLESGMALLSTGHLPEALRVFADVVREDATNVEALLGAAHCALGLDERDGARALLLRILELDPTNDPARAALTILEPSSAADAPAASPHAPSAQAAYDRPGVTQPRAPETAHPRPDPTSRSDTERLTPANTPAKSPG